MATLTGSAPTAAGWNWVPQSASGGGGYFTQNGKISYTTPGAPATPAGGGSTPSAPQTTMYGGVPMTAGGQSNASVYGNNTTATVPGSTSAGGMSQSVQPAIPAATPGSTVSNSGTNSQQMAGQNGPFASLGPSLSSSAAAINAAGQTALQTGMAGLGSTIYNQQLQQEQNQTNVNEAQRGITMSPYGAGVANQADINFNSNWQNQQLARDQQAVATATAAMAPGTGLYQNSYGSSTQGYQTAPPGQTPVVQQAQQVQQPQQAQPILGTGPTQSNITPNVPYSNPVGVPGQTTPSQIPGFPQSTDTSGAVNQTGVNDQAITNPTAQQQLSPQQVMDQATGATDVPQSVLDQMNQQQLNAINNPQSTAISGDVNDWNAITGQITPQTTDSQALSLLAGLEVDANGNPVLNNGGYTQ